MLMQGIKAEIAEVKDDKNAIITLVQDDGVYESGVLLNKIAVKYKIHMTVAGVVNLIKPYSQEWKKIVAGGYLEVICHSWSHLKLDEKMKYRFWTVKHQIKDAIKYIKQEFDTDQIVFIPPENTICWIGYVYLIKSGIYAVRQGNRGDNSLTVMEGKEPGEWFNLRTRGILDVRSTEERNKWIDEAYENKRWLIEMWHNISEKGDKGGYQEIVYDNAVEHVKYIAQMQREGKVWVASFTDAVKYIREKENSEVSIIRDDKKITVLLKCNVKKCKKMPFDFPLTIKLEFDFEIKGIRDINTNCLMDVTRERESYIIKFEMMPNSQKEFDILV